MNFSDKLNTLINLRKLKAFIRRYRNLIMVVVIMIASTLLYYSKYPSILLGKFGHSLLMGVDIKAIKERLEKVNWVKHAVVERSLPDTLYITIVEREPLALWQENGQLHIIDMDGRIIDDNRIDHFTNLLIVIGDDAPIEVYNILQILTKDTKLFKKIMAITRVSGRRWNVRFDDKLEVKLPENNVESAWDYIIKMNKENLLFNRGHNMIDLRINNKLYIK